MKIRVLKFGGTSVDRDERRQMAAFKVIQAKEAGYAPVVVVSAIGREGAPYATDTLIKYLRQIDYTVEPNARELDMMMACGEVISTVVFAHTLKTMGYASVALTGPQAGIATDPVFGSARILEIKPDAIRHYLAHGKIVVVCGFQGSARLPHSEEAITTLGRGGSDTTASALGAALQAEAVDIFTDVDGVKTADPNILPNARTLAQATYAEVAEMAHQGAKVLHPRAAEIAMRYDIPLWVKSTFSDAPGTEIINNTGESGKRITGVTQTGKINYLTLDLPPGSDKDKARIELEILRLTAEAGSSLHLISVAPSFIGFAVPRANFKEVSRYLDSLVIPFDDPENPESGRCYVLQLGDEVSGVAQAQRKLLENMSAFKKVIPLRLNVMENCSLVSIIGQVFFKQPGYFYSTLDALHRAGILVYQTADSDHSMSYLVSESEADRAVKVLHERFELEKPL